MEEQREPLRIQLGRIPSCSGNKLFSPLLEGCALWKKKKPKDRIGCFGTASHGSGCYSEGFVKANEKRVGEMDERGRRRSAADFGKFWRHCNMDIVVGLVIQVESSQVLVLFIFLYLSNLDYSRKWF